MLRNLHIKNMALIDEIEVSFENGLNILTGETGAGKSIILGAITIAMGGKTGKEMVRDGAEYGFVELLFEIDNDQTREAIEALDIDVAEKTLIISRKIFANRVVNKVNDEMVTVGKLKELAGVLLDIHSQHEHQSLLKKANHIRILDRFGHETIDAIKSKVASDFETYSECKKQLNEYSLDEESRARALNFARFERDEIADANLVPGEEEDLEITYQKMTNSKQIMESLSFVHNITGYDSNENAGNQLSRALEQLNKAVAYDPELAGLEEQMETVDSLLNDFNRELSDYMTEMTFDDSEFDEVTRRLNLIHGLEAKYGRTITDVLAYMEAKQEEVERYENYEAYQLELKSRFEQAQKAYDRDSRELSKARKLVAKELDAAITKALQDLNFLDVQFMMVFEEKKEPQKDGMDDAYFCISTNVGEAVRPLSEVASGGELSRVMLAIKSCLADEDAIDTLIFDEIDVGISGRTAQKVSEKLSTLGGSHQVICISHLPQIAAMADAHYKIAKQVVDGKTITDIARLNDEEEIAEIARMLGGVEITDKVLESAAEMKALAKNVSRNR